VFERIILVRLRRLATRARAEGDDVITTGLRGAVVLWFVLAGTFWALQSIALDPGFERFAVDFLRINLIVSLTWVVMRIAAHLVSLYVRRSGGVLSSTTIFTNLTRIVIAAIGGLVIMQAFGIPITPVLTTLGVGGLAVALALQDTLANIFAGVYIIASNKIRIGDYVKLASGEEGTVRDINWRNTTIQGPSSNMIIVPNSTVASAVITNFNLPSTELAVVANLAVCYDSDLEHVERVAIDVAREVMREVEGGVPEFEPVVRFNTFGELRVGFSVVMRGRKFGDQFLIRHEFFKRAHRRFREQGIEFDVPVAMRQVGGGDGKQ
jgi:small-conductance mechanosensitive channel